MLQQKNENLKGQDLVDANRTAVSDEREDIWTRYNKVISVPERTTETVLVEDKSDTYMVDCDFIEWEEVINGERATELLSTSKINRNILKAHVIRIATDIRNDRYHGSVFGEPIQVSGNWHEDNWRLMNGHHRLEAIKDSGTQVKLKFKQGIPYPLMSLMDQSRSRSTNDNLTMQGIGGVSDKASALKLLCKIYIPNGWQSKGGKRIAVPQVYNKVYHLLKDDIERSYRFSKEYSSLLRGSTVGATMVMVMLFDRLSKDMDEDANISTREYWQTLLKKTCCANEMTTDCSHPLHKLSKRMDSVDADAIDNQALKDWHAVWMYEGWLLYVEGIIDAKRNDIPIQRTDKKTGIKLALPKKIPLLWQELCSVVARAFPELKEVRTSLVSYDEE